MVSWVVSLRLYDALCSYKGSFNISLRNCNQSQFNSLVQRIYGYHIYCQYCRVCSVSATTSSCPVRRFVVACPNSFSLHIVIMVSILKSKSFSHWIRSHFRISCEQSYAGEMPYLHQWCPSIPRWTPIYICLFTWGYVSPSNAVNAIHSLRLSHKTMLLDSRIRYVPKRTRPQTQSTSYWWKADSISFVDFLHVG